MTECNYSYPMYAKIIHLGLVVFGIAAFLTGELAEDGSASLGYLLHAYLGLSLAAFMLIRITMGLTRSEALSFRGWFPFSPAQWKLALEDFRTLLALSLPNRDRHQGLAGLTQFFGLFIFALMALTGTALFVLGEGPKTELFEFIEEIHEVGETLIPFYLALHVGAVVLHSMSGNPIWKKMFSLKNH